MPPSAGLSAPSAQHLAWAPQHHAPIASLSPCPNPHPPPATLQLQGVRSSQEKLRSLLPSRDGAMRKQGSRCTFPAKPPAEFQLVGFKKDQSLAEVLDKPSFTWGKTFLILETAWTTQHNRDACRCTSKEGAAPRVHFGKHFHIEFKHLEKRLYALSTRKINSAESHSSAGDAAALCCGTHTPEKADLQTAHPAQTHRKHCGAPVFRVPLN